ncbi:type II toxin-antitoxin system RelE/ParE family toxin [Paraburkholderia silviterrae]|uniref:Type II toxin-antitoxin system RelE/ParE family toxin n=1 Tax=Paraburkholderia silviterrae TaxID=2528715 RepID=A0A4R5LY32_9BURK|nr:type II toxin-antitoxin system RelE/ParE family toxin [Paraburkholderia silviterrae]
MAPNAVLGQICSNFANLLISKQHVDDHVLQRARKDRGFLATDGYSRRLLTAARRHGEVRCRSADAAFARYGGGLFELRPRGHEGIGRVFYCTQMGQRIVILHSFIKKTQETPVAELRIARKRLKEVLDNG